MSQPNAQWKDPENGELYVLIVSGSESVFVNGKKIQPLEYENILNEIK